MKKLRNKITGEINEFMVHKRIEDSEDGNPVYAPFDGHIDEWEDYEEQKGNWTIDPMNENYIDDGRYTAPDELERYEELGLKFNTKEKAEKAVEKLKALTEAKEDGLKIKGYYYNHEDLVILADIGKCNKLTLDTLFGKEID